MDGQQQGSNVIEMAKVYPEQTHLTMKRRVLWSLQKQSLWCAFNVTIPFAKQASPCWRTGVTKQKEILFSHCARTEKKGRSVGYLKYPPPVWYVYSKEEIEQMWQDLMQKEKCWYLPGTDVVDHLYLQLIHLKCLR